MTPHTPTKIKAFYAEDAVAAEEAEAAAAVGDTAAATAARGSERGSSGGRVSASSSTAYEVMEFQPAQPAPQVRHTLHSFPRLQPLYCHILTVAGRPYFSSPTCLAEPAVPACRLTAPHAVAQTTRRAAGFYWHVVHTVCRCRRAPVTPHRTLHLSLYPLHSCWRASVSTSRTPWLCSRRSAWRTLGTLPACCHQTLRCLLLTR